MRTLIPKVAVHLGVCGLILLHSGSVNVEQPFAQQIPCKDLLVYTKVLLLCLHYVLLVLAVFFSTVVLLLLFKVLPSFLPSFLNVTRNDLMSEKLGSIAITMMCLFFYGFFLIVPLHMICNSFPQVFV